MFAFVIEGPDEFRERMTFARPEITIGSAGHNDVVLAHEDVAKLHVVVYCTQSRFTVKNLSRRHTRVNGVPVRELAHVEGAKLVQVGPFQIRLEWIELEASELAAIEEQLIAAILDDRDDASRQVYADWLEQHGFDVRAEFVRLEMSLLPPGKVDAYTRDEGQARLRELATSIDERWRMRVGRGAIEVCGETFPDSTCPREWGALAPTDRDDVRECGACHLTVHYCRTVPEAFEATLRGHPVVVDLFAQRWGRDLYNTRDGRLLPREFMCRNCSLVTHVYRTTCRKCGTAIPPPPDE